MRISPHIGYSHLEEMNLIYEFIHNFDVDNLLYAISGKGLDEDEIIKQTVEIKEFHVKLLRQRQFLLKFSINFPKEFASKDNKMADASVGVSLRMKSGSAGFRRLFKEYCKVSHAPLPPGVSEVQARDVSLITSRNYNLDVFGLSSYPLCVEELFNEIHEFCSVMDDCLAEGLRTVSEVKKIKSDASKCFGLFVEALEKSRKHQQVLIEAITIDPNLKKAVMNNKTFSGDDENPVLKAYKNVRDNIEQFAQKYYKNCSPNDIDKITIHEVESESNENPRLSHAKMVFGSDMDKISRIDYVIEHFDELLPEKCKLSKIPGLNLLFFFEWCKPEVGVEKFLTYFDEYYKEWGGKWGTIGKSSLTGARKRHSKCKDGSTQKLKDKMLMQIDKMLSEKFPKIELAS